MKTSMNQKGQVIVILLLLMLVALSIGLAVTQKSVTDVTTSTQSEQSSRAFSAAEAGIEKALTGTLTPGQEVDLGNSAKALVDSSAELPLPGSNAGVEYPAIGRETTAQIWFTDPDNPAVFYTGSQVDLYFGNENTSDAEKPAVEVKIVMYTNNTYLTQSYYYDSNLIRANSNNFTRVSGCGSVNLANSILGENHKFYCKQTIPSATTNIPNLGGAGNCAPPNCKLILARVRLLYSNENHKIAMAPTLGSSAQLPPQIKIYNATGIAGQSEKQIQAFRVEDVIPPWFDFAVFSVNEITK
jgi:hypothetical protein